MKSIVLSLLIGFSSLAAIGQNDVFFSYYYASDEDNGTLGSFILNSFGANLYYHTNKEKIALYKDEDFKNKLSLEEVELFFSIEQTMQIYNPNNYGDHLDLVDTVIMGWESRDNWLAIKSSSNYLFIQSGKTFENGAFVKREEANMILYGDLILAALNSKMDQSFHCDNFPFVVQSYYDGLQWNLFQNILENPKHLFADITCTEQLKSTDVVYDICLTRQNDGIDNPDNPDDPTGRIDTVITIPANEESLYGIVYYTKSDQRGNSTLHALSFVCVTTFVENWEWNQSAQTYMPKTNSYFIKASDLEKRIGKEQTRHLMLSYLWVLSLGN